MAEKELNLQEILIQDKVHNEVAGYPLRLIEVRQLQQHELNKNNSKLKKLLEDSKSGYELCTFQNVELISLPIFMIRKTLMFFFENSKTDKHKGYFMCSTF